MALFQRTKNHSILYQLVEEACNFLCDQNLIVCLFYIVHPEAAQYSIRDRSLGAQRADWLISISEPIGIGKLGHRDKYAMFLKYNIINVYGLNIDWIHAKATEQESNECELSICTLNAFWRPLLATGHQLWKLLENKSMNEAIIQIFFSLHLHFYILLLEFHSALLKMNEKLKLLLTPLPKCFWQKFTNFNIYLSQASLNSFRGDIFYTHLIFSACSCYNIPRKARLCAYTAVIDVYLGGGSAKKKAKCLVGGNELLGYLVTVYPCYFWQISHWWHSQIAILEFFLIFRIAFLHRRWLYRFGNTNYF